MCINRQTSNMYQNCTSVSSKSVSRTHYVHWSIVSLRITIVLRLVSFDLHKGKPMLGFPPMHAFPQLVLLRDRPRTMLSSNG